MAKAKNQKLRAKKRKIAAKQKEATQKKSEQTSNTLMQLLKMHLNGKTIEAEATCRQMLLTQPENSDIYSLLGVIVHHQARFGEAITLHQKSIELNPNKGGYYSNLGVALNKNGQPNEALDAYNKALELEPNNEQYMFNKAIVQRSLGLFDEAIDTYAKITELKPENPRAYRSLADTLQASGDDKNAIAYHEKVKAIDPDNAKAQYNHSLLLLRQGQFKEGLEQHEARWAHGKATLPDFLLEKSQWDGSPLEGKTIFLHQEQGLGDCIHFIRYAPMIAKQGAKIIVQTRKPLHDLFASMDCIDSLVQEGEPLPAFDIYAPLMSLPYLFSTDENTIPDNVPYFSIDPERRKKFQSLINNNTFNVGIVWAGNPEHENDHNRSITFDQFSSILDIPGITFYSLQKGRDESALQSFKEGKEHIVDLGGQINDFADTAAIMDIIDLTISVDTSPVHLAGALNRPVWNLLPFVPDWRWLTDRNDSPWYPSMRLFRQPAIGQWQPVLDDVRDALLQEITGSDTARTSSSPKHDREKPKNITDIKPTSPDIIQTLSPKLSQALQLIQSGDTIHATSICQDIIDNHPGYADAHAVLGMIAQQHKEYDIAITHYHNAIAINPDKADYHSNLGASLQELKQFDEALTAHQHAINLAPDIARYHYNLGITLRANHQSIQSLDAFDKSLDIEPDHINALIAKTDILQEQGKIDEALALFNEKIEHQPSNPELLYNRAFIHLRAGHLAQGFLDYTTRWQQPDISYRPRHSTIPPWNGDDISQKTLLLWGEQGVGDEIMCASVIVELSKRCKKLIVEVTDRLVPLFARSFPNIDFMPRTNPVNAAITQAKPDIQASIFDVLRWLRQTTNDFHKETQFLYADETKLSTLSTRYLGLGNALKIGISWHTSAEQTGASRSIPLKEWEPLLKIPNTQFVSLQYGDHQAEIDKVNKELGCNIYVDEHIDPLKDMDSFAAQIASMDLIISIDNSTVHLAGALGKPTWTMLTRLADWRWMIEDNKTPWYPTIELFRQQESGNWQSVLHAVKKMLEKKILEHKQGDVLKEIARLYHSGQLTEAKDICNALIEEDSQNAAVWSVIGMIAQQQDSLDEAINAYEHAIKYEPEKADHYNGLGITLYTARRKEEASKAYDKALSINPNHAVARYNRALLLLSEGKLKEGFSEYIQRWNMSEWRPEPDFVKNKPKWDGSNLSGKTLLIHAEQGFGDMIQFIRYTKLLKNTGARIVAECQPELLRLFRNIPDVDVWLETGKPIPPFDVHAAMLDIPGILGTDIDSIPNDIPYLHADTLLIDKWQPQLNEPEFKIGIVWQGRKKPFDRSTDLRFFERLLDIPNTQFYVLQTQHDNEKQLDSLVSKYTNIKDLGSAIEDFADTAAIIAQLDLVITIDTSAAHLAAALGTDVWVLLTYRGDWRWDLDKKTCPWYPTMHLYQQPTDNDWETVFTQIHKDLIFLPKESKKTLPVADFSSQASIQLAPMIDIDQLLQQAAQSFQLKQFEQTSYFCNQIIDAEPDNGDAHNLIAAIAYHQKDIDNAIIHQEKALEQQPKNPNWLANLGNLYRVNRSPSESLNAYKKAIEIEDSHAQWHYGLGVALFSTAQFDQAVDALKKALEIDPDYYRAIYMLANSLRAELRVEEALEYYDKAYAIKPNDPELRFNRAHTLLFLDRYEEGFKEFEARWENIASLQMPSITKNIPLWEGEDLTGKTILVHMEQGMGDGIQFVRYVPIVESFGGKVMCACREPLLELFKSCSSAEWIPDGSKISSFDVHIPMISIPRVLKTTVDNVPNKVPYLHADAKRIEQWKPFVNKGDFKVGLVWGGNPKNENDHNRSSTLEHYKPFLDIPGIHFYSLQKGRDETRIAEYEQTYDNFTDLGTKVNDFADTAAIIEQLDLMVTIETSVSHLAGALAKETWTMLHYVPDWRYHIQGDSCVWYPTMRLFRQDARRSWEPVVETICKELTQRITP